MLPTPGTVDRVLLRWLFLPVPVAVSPARTALAVGVLAAPCRRRTSSRLREPAQRQGRGTGRSVDGRRRRVFPDPPTESHRRWGKDDPTQPGGRSSHPRTVGLLPPSACRTASRVSAGEV